MIIEKKQKIKVAFMEPDGWFNNKKITREVVVREILHYGGLTGYNLIVLDEMDGTFFKTVTELELKGLITEADPRGLAKELLSIEL